MATKLEEWQAKEAERVKALSSRKPTIASQYAVQAEIAVQLERIASALESR